MLDKPTNPPPQELYFGTSSNDNNNDTEPTEVQVALLIDAVVTLSLKQPIKSSANRPTSRAAIAFSLTNKINAFPPDQSSQLLCGRGRCTRNKRIEERYFEEIMAAQTSDSTSKQC
jgi:hypothetical protein